MELRTGKLLQTVTSLWLRILRHFLPTQNILYPFWLFVLVKTSLTPLGTCDLLTLKKSISLQSEKVTDS